MDIQLAALKFYDHSSFIRGYAKATIRRYKFVINYYCNYCHITEFEQINEENLRKLFFYGRTERKWSTNTYINFIKSLVVFFRWCVKEGYMTENFAEKIEIPKLEKRLPPKLTKQQTMRLLEVVYNYPYQYKFLRYRNHSIFAMFIMAGLRKSELLNLKFADVDLENLTIFVRQGKGGKDRMIPICFALAETLKRYVQERKRLHKTCPEFFASLNRNMGFTQIGLRRLVDLAKRSSKINFGIHKLRHSFAVLMLEGGCDIYSLSKMRGHSDIKTTTIYLSATAEHLRAQITKHPLNNL